MKRMMKQMGIESEEMEGVEEVIIRAADKEYVILGAQVTRMNVKGQATVFQVVGEPEERAKGSGTPGKPAIPVEDIRLVAEKAGVSEEEARKALEECNGEPAEAIIKLMSR
jgi:nascent polypeptide-associated complex subunit alpha